jgi:pyridoxal biosynthesis lyase PdxS
MVFTNSDFHCQDCGTKIYELNSDGMFCGSPLFHVTGGETCKKMVNAVAAAKRWQIPDPLAPAKKKYPGECLCGIAAADCDYHR